ncbi:MAG: hypothetical protein A2Z99_04420 [Treponema sp. GWB1_62_6]|nr:MAG: hypothetical protein A2001_03735 [Treponema sp. GWC1_61_84]OHE70241.1 MAG: hypothetical protein A2Z99_04420 [Treponema sp. GWB1_62_6]OHE75865.1 MAG: hypothetical protein A2413_11620 [Treponema sp. RIFOXYC1_FULL_61_9]HCM26403.1 hypothetical protein [Treponema sp.]
MELVETPPFGGVAECVASLRAAYASLGAYVAALRLPIGNGWVARSRARRHPCASPSHPFGTTLR